MFSIVAFIYNIYESPRMKIGLFEKDLLNFVAILNF